MTDKTENDRPLQVKYLGLFGAGVVAGGVVGQLRAQRSRCWKLGVDLRVKTICCRNTSKKRDFTTAGIAKGDGEATFTDNIYDILDDDEISIVVEAMGGTKEAKEVVTEAAKRNKDVVTANKVLLAEHMDELLAVFRKQAESSELNAPRFCFEAAVAGGVPVIRAMQQSVELDIIYHVSGILNGTTNYILTEMEKRISEDGISISGLVKEAQAKGYAEADPTADIEGYDARAKIAILTKLAFGKTIHDVSSSIPTFGITAIRPEDFEILSKGFPNLPPCTIRLVAVAERPHERWPDVEEDASIVTDESMFLFQKNESVLVYVAPTVVPKTHPLAAVQGSHNMIKIDSRYLGTSTFTAAGAGRWPTSNSVVADVIQCSMGWAPQAPIVTESPREDAGELHEDINGEFFLRLTLHDRFYTDAETGKREIARSLKECLESGFEDWRSSSDVWESELEITKVLHSWYRGKGHCVNIGLLTPPTSYKKVHELEKMLKDRVKVTGSVIMPVLRE